MAAGVSEEAPSRRASPQPQQQQQCIVVVAAWREFCAAATPSNIPLRSGLVHRLSRRMELLTKRWPGSTICELTTSMMKEAEAWERWRRGRRGGREEQEAPHTAQCRVAALDRSKPARGEPYEAYPTQDFAVLSFVRWWVFCCCVASVSSSSASFVAPRRCCFARSLLACRSTTASPAVILLLRVPCARSPAA